MADWTRYLLVSGGDPNLMQMAAQQLSKAGFDVTLMEGVPVEVGQTIAQIESARPVTVLGPVPLSIVDHGPELVAGSVRIDVPGRRLYVGSQLTDLTASEFSLCEYLIRNRDRVVDKPELMRYLRGSDHYSPNLIEAIVSAVRRKLGADAAAMIETVRGVGYIVRSDSSSD